VTRLLRQALSYELGLWRSLYRWMFRRPLGAGTFGYASPVTPLLAAFIGVSAIEIRSTQTTPAPSSPERTSCAQTGH
jgi:hypothetical protein